MLNTQSPCCDALSACCPGSTHFGGTDCISAVVQRSRLAPPDPGLIHPPEAASLGETVRVEAAGGCSGGSSEPVEEVTERISERSAASRRYGASLRAIHCRMSRSGSDQTPTQRHRYETEVYLWNPSRRIVGRLARGGGTRKPGIATLLQPDLPE